MAANSKKRRCGFTDRPEIKDSLGMNSRCKGISRFIESCETPMTLAVQGDWGTGKTTAMQIIRNNLSESNRKCTIWFNTWEFSIYSRSENIMAGLIELMILRLREYLNLPDGDTGKALGNVAKKLISVAGECSAPVKVIDTVIDKFGGVEQKEKIKALVDQKNTLDALVNKLGSRNSDRFFVFIDDLDRLDPGIAIEILEGLKNLAEYENFVYIYAIDQSVVERGLKSKYGDEFDGEKARKFFDKIIQVPFSLPVTSYDISGYISGFIGQNEGENPDEYTALLEAFGIRNPRTIKRSFNLLQLYSFIDEAECGEHSSCTSSTEKYNLKNYSLMLLRLECPELYEEISSIVSNNQDDFPEMYKQLILSSTENGSRSLDAICRLFFPDGYTETYHEKYEPMIKSFSSMVLQRRDMNDEKDEWRSEIPAAGMLCDIYRTLRSNPDIVFDSGWDRFSFSAENLAKTRGSIKAEAVMGNQRLRITWYSSSRLPNMTVYSSEHTRETFLAGAEDHFNCVDDNIKRTESKFNYHYNESGEENRITVILNPNSGLRKYFNRFLKNCGFVTEQNFTG